MSSIFSGLSVGGQKPSQPAKRNKKTLKPASAAAHTAQKAKPSLTATRREVVEDRNGFGDILGLVSF